MHSGLATLDCSLRQAQDLYPLVAFLPRYAAMPGQPIRDIDMTPMWRVSELVTSEPGVRRAALRTVPASSAGLAGHGHNKEASDSSADVTAGNSRASTSASAALAYDPESLLPTVESDRALRPARDPPRSHLYDYLPFLRLPHAIMQYFKRTTSAAYARRKRGLLGHRKFVAHVESNVPLEISLYLSSYLSWLLQKGLLTPALAAAITANIHSLQDASLSLQRIRTT
jgi:putative membrane protein